MPISQLLNVKSSFSFIQFKLGGLRIEPYLTFQIIDSMRGRTYLCLSDNLVSLMVVRMIRSDYIMPRRNTYSTRRLEFAGPRGYRIRSILLLIYTSASILLFFCCPTILDLRYLNSMIIVERSKALKHFSLLIKVPSVSIRSFDPFPSSHGRSSFIPLNQIIPRFRNEFPRIHCFLY